MNGTMKIESRENPVIGHTCNPAYGNVPLVDLPMMSDQRWKVKLKIQSVVEQIEDERELKIIFSFIQGLKKQLTNELAEQNAVKNYTQDREGGRGVAAEMV